MRGSVAASCFPANWVSGSPHPTPHTLSLSRSLFATRARPGNIIITYYTVHSTLYSRASHSRRRSPTTAATAAAAAVVCRHFLFQQAEEKSETHYARSGGSANGVAVDPATAPSLSLSLFLHYTHILLLSLSLSYTSSSSSRIVDAYLYYVALESIKSLSASERENLT